MDDFKKQFDQINDATTKVKKTKKNKKMLNISFSTVPKCIKCKDISSFINISGNCSTSFLCMDCMMNQNKKCNSDSYILSDLDTKFTEYFLRPIKTFKQKLTKIESRIENFMKKNSKNCCTS